MPNTDDVNERYDQAQIQAEQRLEQIRQEMGADNKVFEPDLFRSLPSVSSPFGTSQPELSARGGAPGVEQALRDMTRHSFYAALPEIQQNLG